MTRHTFLPSTRDELLTRLVQAFIDEEKSCEVTLGTKELVDLIDVPGYAPGHLQNATVAVLGEPSHPRTPCCRCYGGEDNPPVS